MTTLLLARIALSAVATTLAAIAAERALRDVGRAGRAVWAAALVLTAVASVLLVSGGRLPLSAPSRVSQWLAEPGGTVTLRATTSALAAPAFDPLPFAWLTLSLALAGMLAITLLRQRRRLGAQPIARVSGVEVVVTRALGPAVFGFLHPRIVVPDWLLERPEAERRLVVEHEAEHIAARDPLLGAAGLLVVCLVPWNPLLWYQLRRLRLAIELDCDARVLRRGDARAYGRLLVDVADRLARGTPLATALAFPRNFLEWRIRMIVNRRIRPLRAAVFTVAAGALAVVACADAADPTAVAEPQPFETRLDVADSGEKIELSADEMMYDAERQVVMLRSLTPPIADGENATPGEWRIEVDELAPTSANGETVQFRATLGDDDRPIRIDFDAADLSDEEKARLGAELGQYQFRRSMADPDAPVEGAIQVD